jgi:hypothetical protein
MHRNEMFPCYTSTVNRVIVLKGKYLFRYRCNEKSGEPTGDVKGVPILLTEAHIQVNDDDPCSFDIETMYKSYTFTCSNSLEVDNWVEALGAVRVNTLRTELGHVEESKSDIDTNRIAEELHISHRKQTEAVNREKDMYNNDISLHYETSQIPVHVPYTPYSYVA